jgi:hypothetical protein
MLVELYFLDSFFPFFCSFSFFLILYQKKNLFFFLGNKQKRFKAVSILRFSFFFFTQQNANFYGIKFFHFIYQKKFFHFRLNYLKIKTNVGEGPKSNLGEKIIV